MSHLKLGWSLIAIVVFLLFSSCLTLSDSPPAEGDQFILRVEMDRALAVFLDTVAVVPQHADASIVTIPNSSGRSAIEYRLVDMRKNAARHTLGPLLTLQGAGANRPVIVTISLPIVRTQLNLSATPLLPPVILSSREELYLYYSWNLGGIWNDRQLRKILDSMHIEIIVIPPGASRSSSATFRRRIPFVEFVTSTTMWVYTIP